MVENGTIKSGHDEGQRTRGETVLLAAFGTGLAFAGLVFFHTTVLRRRANEHLSAMNLPPITLRQAMRCRVLAKSAPVQLTFSEEGNKAFNELFHTHALAFAKVNVAENPELYHAKEVDKILSRGWVREDEETATPSKPPVDPPFGLGVTGQERELRRMVPQNRRMYETAKRMDNQLYKLKNDAKKSNQK